MACAARIGCAHQSQRSGSLVVVFTRCSRASIASPLRPLKQGACRREDLRPRRDLRGWERPGACQVGAHPVSRLSRSAALTAGTRSPSVAAMDPLALGRLRISTLVERAGPTRPTWLFPDAAPEAVERHRDWLPSPRARYLSARREGEHWSSERDEDTRRIMADSVRPVLEAGLAELVDADQRITDEIWLEPTPGHTPGHGSVRLASGDREAVITGDLMHHPIQMAEPRWASHFDSDVEQARKTRRAFCERYADGPVTVLGTHFNHPTVGRILRHGRSEE